MAQHLKEGAGADSRGGTQGLRQGQRGCGCRGVRVHVCGVCDVYGFAVGITFPEFGQFLSGLIEIGLRRRRGDLKQTTTNKRRTFKEANKQTTPSQ